MDLNKDSLRVIMALVAHFDLHLHQMDVKTAFLNGDLEEDIYMVQPEGFVQEGGKSLVCKLCKSIYGLKQASRQWYLKFNKSVYWKISSNPGQLTGLQEKSVKIFAKDKDYKLTFKRSDTLELQGYADADFAGCQDSLKSTSVSWRSVKQPLTAGSTMFAEFLACYEATSQAIWLRNFIISLNVVESIHRPIQIWNDNSAVVLFAKGNKRTKGSRLLDVKFIIVKEKIAQGYTDISHISTDRMIADPLTKGIPNAVFHRHALK
ncbi:transposable element gene [Prunus dulcis]|uniref:Transposable element protein n=1 Tax=Prunus dulcis TaxID=3755 RepID=A0A4Y1R6P5_PRUDU|nr:transposable element gene [Prunus dulcis]